MTRSVLAFFVLIAVALLAPVTESNPTIERRSTTAVVDPCIDGDGDGYGTPGDESCPNGPEEDCDDSDPAINPGAEEICNGIDDNCNREIDECEIGDPDPVMGPCFSYGFFECSADPNAPVCELTEEPILFSEEVAGTPTCFDGVDNDCDEDGLVDHEQSSCQTQEFCNGFDDDNNGLIDDGFDLDMACTVGSGACEVHGVTVCSSNELDVICEATAGSPGTEGPPGGGACGDGVDNDCDSLLDLQDPDCQEAERCDGRDNDGDGLVDEGFDLGQSCATGAGECMATGETVCDLDGAGTVCNAVPVRGSREGPAGETCRDGLDNDCDGSSDAMDPDCASANLEIRCSLPVVRGDRGSDCGAWHRIGIEVSGAGPGATVTAELLGLDPDGGVLEALPVRSGEMAHLVSRSQVVAGSRATRRGKEHTMFAPVPLLRARVQDGLISREAFCSPIPYLQIIRPTDSIVTGSLDGVTEVLAALPLADPATLSVRVDGVDIIDSLGLDPDVDFPGGPFSGDALVRGRTVHVAELFVDAGRSVSDPAANTLRMELSDLSGGGHIVIVEADTNHTSSPNRARTCHADDMTDKAVSNNFELTITSPLPEEITSVVPTPVAGTVAHGREIASLQINGLEIDTSAQQFVPGDGETIGDTFRLPFHTTLDRTDLAAELETGAGLPGTLDAGWNRLVARATDDRGNGTYADLFVAIVPPEEPGAAGAEVPPRPVRVNGPAIAGDGVFLATAPLGSSGGGLPLVTGAADTENMLVSSVSGSAMRNLMATVYASIGPDFFDGLVAQYLDLPLDILPGPITVVQSVPAGDCTASNDECDEDDDCPGAKNVCNATCKIPLWSSSRIAPSGACEFPIERFGVGLKVTDIRLDVDRFSFEDEATVFIHPHRELEFRVGFPDATLDFELRPYRRYGFRLFRPFKDPHFVFICVLEIAAHFEFSVTVKDLEASLRIGESQLTSGGSAEERLFQSIDAIIDTLDVDARKATLSDLSTRRSTVSIGCAPKEARDRIRGRIRESIRKAVAGALERNDFLSTKLTEFVNKQLDNKLNDIKKSLKETVRDPELLPVQVGIPPSLQARNIACDGQIDAVHFNPDMPPQDPIIQEGAIGAAVSGSCATPNASDGLQSLPRSTAPAPEGPLPGAENSFVTASDDALNQLIETMVRSQHFEGFENGECRKVGTVDDLFPGDDPDDCASTGASAIEGYCRGLRDPGVDCESLSGDTKNDTADVQGACHGATGASCNSIPTPRLCCGRVVFGVCTNPCLDCSAGAGGRSVPSSCAAREIAQCQAFSSLNLEAGSALYACPRLEVYPGILVRQTDPMPPPFVVESPEVAIRLNDVVVPIVISRTGDPVHHTALDTLPFCGGRGDTLTGDCVLFNTCADLNIGMGFDVVEGGNGNPALRPFVTDIEKDVEAGQLCYTCGASPIVSTLFNSNALCRRAKDALVPFLNDALDEKLGVIELPFPLPAADMINPRLIAIETDGDPNRPFMDYLGISVEIPPPDG